MSIETTELQASIVRYIQNVFVSEFRNPSVRELCKAFPDENGKPKAPNAIQGHLNRLVAKGVLIGGEGKSRSYRIAKWNPFGGESQTSRIGENYVVCLVSANRVAFMIFSDSGMVESGVYSMEAAVKMADGRKVDASLAVIDRLAKVAEWIVSKKIEVTA